MYSSSLLQVSRCSRSSGKWVGFPFVSVYNCWFCSKFYYFYFVAGILPLYFKIYPGLHYRARHLLIRDQVVSRVYFTFVAEVISVTLGFIVIFTSLFTLRCNICRCKKNDVEKKRSPQWQRSGITKKFHGLSTTIEHITHLTV